MKTGVPHISRAGLVFGELRVFMRTDGRFAIFDKRKPIADQSVGVFGRIDEAIAEAKRLAALDEPAKARGEKKYDGDAEAFAGMKRAMENGFAPHEPAEDVELVPFTGASFEEAKALIEGEPGALRDALERLIFKVNDVEINGEVLTRPDCPKCGVGFCELDCSCACHLAELPT